MDAFCGEIRLFAFPMANFLTDPAIGQVIWAPCNGQLLQIMQYQKLYSLLETRYGGDGRSTFAVPDLRGRIPISFGQDTFGNTYQIGQKGGAESVALTTDQVPIHSHTFRSSSAIADKSVAKGFFPATIPAATPIYSTNKGKAQILSPETVSNKGAGAPHENIQPSIVMGYYINTFGPYPIPSEVAPKEDATW